MKKYMFLLEFPFEDGCDSYITDIEVPDDVDPNEILHKLDETDKLLHKEEETFRETETGKPGYAEGENAYTLLNRLCADNKQWKYTCYNDNCFLWTPERE